MALQINFTNLTDCGYSATSDLGSGIADAIGFDIANYDFAFKDDEGYDRLEGNGYFEEKYPYRHKSDKDFLDGINYCTVVVSRSKDVKTITAHLYKQISINGFPIHRVLLLCSDTFFERIKKNNNEGNLIEVSIKLSDFFEDDYYDKGAKADIEEVTLSNNAKNFDGNLIDNEIEDIKNYLIKKSCVGKYGQVADICDEFAQSFRHISKKESKFDLVDEIISLISSFRFFLQSAMSKKDADFFDNLREKYDFNSRPHDRDFGVEFAKITDKKELSQAINIFNHLWTKRNARYILEDGFVITEGEAESLAHIYLKLKFVKSEIVEKIIIDLLIATKINEEVRTLQYIKKAINVPNKIEENNLLRDLCNLHTLVDSYKTSCFKSLLSKVTNEGTIFPNFMYSIVD